MSARGYQCHQCPSSYYLKRDLDCHRRIDREWCMQCGQWVCRLDVHRRSVHGGGCREVHNVDDLIQPKIPFLGDAGFQVAYMGRLGEISDFRHVSKYHQTWNIAAGDGFSYRNLTIWLCEIYRYNTTAFKINMGIGFLLFHPIQKIYKYHYVSENSLLFDKSIVVDSVVSLKSFIERVRGLDLATSAYLTKPSSQWVLAGITNFQCRVTVLPGILLGYGQLPEYLKNLKSIYSLTGLNGKEYKDFLCLFRCIAIHHGQPVRGLERYTRMIGERYEQLTGLDYRKGVALHNLPRIEVALKMIINVFSLDEDGTVRIVYKSPLVFSSLDRSMNLNLYEKHYSYIRDMSQYGNKFACLSCSRIFNRRNKLHLHMKICVDGGRNQVFVGGRLKKENFETIWEKLDRIGISVTSPPGKYDFCSVFDWEALQVPTKDQYRGMDTHFIHFPATVSLCSNIPTFRHPIHYQSNGDTQKLVDCMVWQLLEYQKEASRLMRRKYHWVFMELWERMQGLDEGDEMTHLKWLYTTLARYTDVLPVVGFNSGRYDIPLVRRFLPLALKRMDSLPTFIIKKGRSYMSLCTKRLQFLDLTNFLGAGTSLKSFYKAYKVTQGKGLFPYSWFSSLDKLEAPGLPARDPLFRKALDTGDEEAIKRLMPYDPFYDILHLNTISNEDFDECHNEYRRLGMKKFGDYVKYYNNLDVTGMVEGLEKMAKIYEDHGLVMLKDAVSLPRLSQKIIFRSLTEDNYFVCFDKQHRYIFQELRDKIVGGPSIIFTRYAEAGVTRIRNGPELCKTVEGWDANSLYLWGTGKKQCTGPYTLLEKKYGYRKHTKVKGARGLKYSQKGVNWINFLQEERGYYIRTAENHCLGEKRILNFYVDGFAEPNKVFEFLGCYFHGHNCSEKNRPASKWAETMERIEKLRSLGYDVEYITECEWKKPVTVTIPRPSPTVQELVAEIVTGEVFGIVCCDLHVPPHLIEKFSPFPPIFKNTSIDLDNIGSHMQRYCKMIGRNKGVDRCLISSMFGTGLVMLTPLFKMYIEMGLICTGIEFLLEYNPQPVFQWFTDKVANDRRESDLDPDKGIIGETSKLIGNASYGYCCIDKSKHMKCFFCNEEDIARHVNDPNFVSLEELDGGMFEVVKKKSRIVQDTPLQVAIGVYSYAKMKLLEFWLFLDKHLDRNLWCLIECDTDSLYFALGRDSLDECVRPEMRTSWEKSKDSILCSQSDSLRADGVTEKQWSKREPGLFKLEFKGEGMIALNSKVYIAWNDDGSKKSAKGMQERNDNLVVENFKEALFQQRPHYVQNSGFVVDGTTTLTYTQMKRGLSYLYCKRKVLEDGITTTHLDI